MLDRISLVVTIVGAINWLLVDCFNSIWSPTFAVARRP